MEYSLSNSLVGGSGSINPDALSLDLQFATDKTLTARKGPTPVFIRGSTATFIGSNGLIQSAAIDTPRFDHNPVTLECKGLLIEGQRTNLLFPSESLATQTRLVTAVPHTLSFYGTGTIVLSGARVATVTGTGAFPTRTTLTFTPSAANLVLTVTGTVTQAQLEVGSFVSSYIPTVDSSLTRSADECAIVDSDFLSFYNQTEGTFISSSSQPVITSTNAIVYQVDDGDNFNRLTLRHQSSVAISQVDASTQCSFDMANPTANSISKIAFAYKENQYQAARNSILGSSASNLAVPSVNQIYFGTRLSSSSEFLSGHIQSIKYFKKRLSDSKLQSLTT
jgi:hypothetical protein